MKIEKEMRQRQDFEQPKSANPIPIVLGAMIAFGIGVLGISGLIKTPHFILAKPKTIAIAVPAPAAETKTGIEIDNGGRIGSAQTAPLLKMCFPMKEFGMGRDKFVAPNDIYRILQTASNMAHVAAIAGIHGNVKEGAHFASLWGEVADCIYRQNGWMLCDPDNRALAVEAASAFVRQLSTAVRSEASESKGNTKAAVQNQQNRAYALQNASAIKDRVLASLRHRASEGRLTAGDFGFFAPAEILQAVRESKVTRDACAERQ